MSEADRLLLALVSGSALGRESERGGVQREGEANEDMGRRGLSRSNRRTKGQPNKTFQGDVK
jgi:hypothetical protein